MDTRYIILYVCDKRSMCKLVQPIEIIVYTCRSCPLLFYPLSWGIKFYEIEFLINFFRDEAHII